MPTPIRRATCLARRSFTAPRCARVIPDWLQWVNTCFNVAMYGHETEIYDAAFKEFFGEKRPPQPQARVPVACLSGACGARAVTLPPELQCFVWRYFDRLGLGAGAQPGAGGGRHRRRHLHRPRPRAARARAGPRRAQADRGLMSNSSATCRCCCWSIWCSTASPASAASPTSATTSFIITLAVYAGAYLVEVFRAGLDAIPRGLIDAGRAIGLTPWQRMLYVQAADHAAHRAAVAVERLHLACSRTPPSPR